jgi:hypothetical protein
MKEGEVRENEDGRREQEWERMRLAESNWVAASRDRAVRNGHIDEAESVRDIAEECRAEKYSKRGREHEQWQATVQRMERADQKREKDHIAQNAEAEVYGRRV